MNYLTPPRERSLCLGRVLRHSWARWRTRIPGLCPMCDEDSAGAQVCRYCYRALWRDPASLCLCCGLALGGRPHCPDCAARPFAFERAVCAFDYAFPGDILIQRLKIQHRYDLAPALASLMYASWRQADVSLAGDLCWIALPSRPESVRLRGFSLPVLLARRLASLSGHDDLSRQIVWRGMQGKAQKRLGRRERLQGLDQAWESRTRLAGRSVVLVDDVMTTGASLDSLARLCLQAGALQVFGLVAARTPWRSRPGLG